MVSVKHPHMRRLTPGRRTNALHNSSTQVNMKTSFLQIEHLLRTVNFLLNNNNNNDDICGCEGEGGFLR